MSPIIEEAIVAAALIGIAGFLIGAAVCLVWLKGRHRG